MKLFVSVITIFVVISFLSMLPLWRLKQSADICGSKNCAPQNATVLEKEFSAQELTQIINKNKPADILLTGIKIAFINGKIQASATSFYPFLPGKIEAVLRPNLKYFKVEKITINGLKGSESQLNFVEANGNGLWDNLQVKNNVLVELMEIRGDKLYVKALVPKSMVL